MIEGFKIPSDREGLPECFDSALSQDTDTTLASGSRRWIGRAQLVPWQVRAAKELMSAETHHTVPLSAVAEKLGISVNHFIKAFANSVGVAPYHWFLNQRIARSLGLLLDDVLTMSEIASVCGFSDQSHYTRAFRRLIGITPGNWRRKTRAGGSDRAMAIDLARDRLALMHYRDEAPEPNCG